MLQALGARALYAALLAVLLAAAPAQAASFNVTKTTDTNDAACTPADCSLREAIGAAQGAAGDDVVNVPAGTYILSAQLGELVYNPSPAAALTVVGAGARTTAVDGADNALDILAGTVTIIGLTMRNGSATFTGGGLQTSSGTTTTLRDVTIADNVTGDGGDGGGIYNLGVMTLVNVAVTGNRTTFGGDGGGIYTNGELHLVNVTISGNFGGSGGGIYAAGGTFTSRNATVTANTGGSTGQGGGIFSGRIPELTNTIVARNLAGAGASNCSFGAGATSNGGNLEGGTECGFVAATDRQNTDPLLLPLGNYGGQTNTHALAPTSPAIDTGVAAGCPGTDQRGVFRPLGAACDIGAYEFQPPDTTAPVTTIITGPRGITTDLTPTFSFSSTDPGSTFQCRLDGGPFVACTSPLTLPELVPGRHRFEVRAIDAAGNPDPTPAASDFEVVLPSPVLGRLFNVEPLSGEVFISQPPGQARASRSVRGIKGRNFVPLRSARQVPIGSLLDARKGRVRITSARDSRGTPQAGDFTAGVFQVLQSRRRRSKGLTELRLKGSSFRSCRRARRSDRSEVAAARRSRRTIRRLRSNSRGRFRTRGRYSAATVRGTRWLTADRCDGTLTTVSRGRVAVRDFRRKKTIVVRAGKRYLARAPG